MAIRRMLSRRISQSKKVNKLSLKSQLIWTWILPYLDDYGRYTADPEDIKTEVFPKNKKISVKDIKSSLQEIANIGLVKLYSVENQPYQEYSKFNDYQTFRADRDRRAEYPGYASGIPMTPNDTRKLSKVKLSKDKLREDSITANNNIKHGDFVALTPQEYQKLKDTYGKGVITQYIDRLNSYIGSKGKKYKSHYYTILNWLNKDNMPKKKKVEPVEIKQPDPKERTKVRELVRQTVETMK